MKEIEPRKLILARGTPEASHQLATSCQSSVSDKIFTPKTGDIVDATTENHIYQVKLTDSLVTALNFSRSEDGTELAWVEGVIESSKERSLLPAVECPSDQNPPSTQAIQAAPNSSEEMLPSLEALQLDQVPIHKTFINELKLSDFKQTLLNHGIQAEFIGGALYCNNKIAVRRREEGKIHLEGTVGPIYYKVRKILYDHYLII
ncbi:Cleavage and polyadenylation specificity factor subunit 2, partial [Fragariocoptes setiger]